ncbi:MAG: entericidin A/B family lipoprotein [Desulfohalobiaceae bacterium]|nr:entericidin A/B family lipoprotein [Desulfohalobiaceae bacterium]
MRPWIKIIATLFLAVGLFAGTVGCNTFEGMGEDIQSAGESIEEEASD